MKNFLAVGDVIINPDQLAYAALDGDPEQPKLRLVFAPGTSPSSRGELRLEGEDAKAALRWLRLNSSFANGTAAFGTASSPLHWGAPTSTVRPNLRERDRDRCILEGAAR
jgi:hypothetical protein